MVSTIFSRLLVVAVAVDCRLHSRGRGSNDGSVRTGYSVDGASPFTVRLCINRQKDRRLGNTCPKGEEAFRARHRRSDRQATRTSSQRERLRSRVLV